MSGGYRELGRKNKRLIKVLEKNQQNCAALRTAIRKMIGEADSLKRQQIGLTALREFEVEYSEDQA